jgi:hypothetical protein
VTALKSLATPRFWKLFSRLPAEVQDLAVRKYDLFKRNPFHPSLGFQEKGRVWTVEIGRPIGRSPCAMNTCTLGFGLEVMKSITTF